MKHILEHLKKEYFTTLRYEQLLNMKVGEAVITAAVNHWEPFGFLQGIEDEDKKNELAVAFDNMAHDLIFENERVVKIEKRYNFNCSNEEANLDKSKFCLAFDFSTIVFPVLRRVIYGTKLYKDGVDNFNYDKFLTYLERLSFLAINYDGYEGEFDVEAEFTAILSDVIIEFFNRKV